MVSQDFYISLASLEAVRPRSSEHGGEDPLSRSLLNSQPSVGKSGQGRIHGLFSLTCLAGSKPERCTSMSHSNVLKLVHISVPFEPADCCPSILETDFTVRSLEQADLAVIAD